MHALKISHISKRYGSAGSEKSVLALDDVSLEVERGEIFSVLGLNGAGKTTLVKLIAGLIEPDSGYIEAPTIAGARPGAYVKHVGAVFEGNRNVYWRLTPFENLEYFAALRGMPLRLARKRAGELVEQFNLADKRDVPAGKLSRGMQQRLAIAISIIHDPRILLLDEPTLGVDIENVLEIIDFLKRLKTSGVCVILTSHQMDLVKTLSDRIAILASGRLLTIEDVSSFSAHVAGDLCRLSMVEKLDEQRLGTLTALGASWEEGALSFAAEQLYKVLDVVRPLQIKAFSHGEQDFTRIFLAKINEGTHA